MQSPTALTETEKKKRAQYVAITKQERGMMGGCLLLCKSWDILK